MIAWSRFGENEKQARQVVENASTLITSMIEVPASLEICESHRDAPYLRMAEIEGAIYPDDIAYDPTDFAEFVERDDAILLILTIDGAVEGYVFGYPEDPEEPIVNEAEYFVDDGVVSMAWERRGIGTVCGMAIFSLVRLMGFTVIGITTEEKDANGRELVNWYHSLGFEDATTDYCDDWALTLEMTKDRMAAFLQALGVEG